MSSQRKRLFEDALQEVLDHLRPERALVMFERDSQQLAVWAAHGVEKDAVWTSAPLSLTVFKRVYTSGEPILTADAQHDPSLEESSSLLLTGIRSMLCVPIRFQERVRGLLYADLRMSQSSFTHNDLVLMTNLSRDLERRLKLEAAPAPVRTAPSKAPLSLKLSHRARVVWMRGLNAMLAAGVSLGRALTLLADQGEDKETRAVSTRVRDEVEQGQPLSDGMRRCGPAFSEFQLQLVRVGEHTGALVDVLGQLAEYDERQRALGMRMRASLTYPVLLFLACTAMLLVIPPLFLRGQTHLLELSGVQPPLITRLVLGMAGFLSSPLGFLSVAGSLLALVLFLRGLQARPSGRLWMQRRLLAMPLVGRLCLLLGTTRFARSLALQIKVGLPILQAVGSAASAANDPLLALAIKTTLEELRDGAELAPSLAAADYFPRSFLVLLRAGEESGQLESSLQWLARLYELELESSLESLCAALEPLMMLGMGVAAALICLATMLPLVQLVQSL